MLLNLNLQFFNDDYDPDYFDLDIFKNDKQYNRYKKNFNKNDRRLSRYINRRNKADKRRLQSVSNKYNAKKNYAKFKENSKVFLSSSDNWHLIFRLFGFTFAFIFATLSLGDGTLRFIESYKTTIHNDNYAFNNGDITFYNYDWEFKIKQLDNFAPMFTINDDYDNQQLAPNFYYQSFKRLVESGDIIYNYDWELTSTGLESDFAKKIFYYRFKFRGHSDTFPVRWIFGYDNGDVVISDDKLYQKWTNQYEQRKWFEDTAFSKYVLGSTLVVLNLPTNFTYNMLCAFDLILRW